MPQKKVHGYTNDNLEYFFSKLSSIEKKFIEEVKIYTGIGGAENKGSLHTMDLYTSAIINRSISLIQGFLLLSKVNNYISSVPIIRMQVDNCLRFYAATLVANYDDFFLKYLEGIHIGKIEDINGNKMTDSYLVEHLDKNVASGIKKLYKNTSGFIHLSNEHIFLQINQANKKERIISTKIGGTDFYDIDRKVDFAFNMLKASEILLKLVQSWKFQKMKVEEQISRK